MKKAPLVAGLGNLPAEIIIYIAEMVIGFYSLCIENSRPLPATIRYHFLKPLLLLNRTWFKALDNYNRMHSVDLRGLDNARLLSYYDTVKVNGTELSTRHLNLELPNPPWDTEEKALSLLARSRRVKTLYVNGLDLTEMKSSLPASLTELTLSKCLISLDQLLVIGRRQPSSLLSLTLQDTYLQFPLSLLLPCFSNLSFLSLKNTPIAELSFLSFLPKLVSLDLSGTHLEVSHLTDLTVLAPHLSHLGIADLSWFNRNTDELADILDGLSSLVSLDVINNNCGFNALLHFENLQYTKLSLGSDVFMGDHQCRTLFSNLSLLLHLEFSSSCSLSDVNLKSISSRCKSLETLIIPTQASLPSLKLISPYTLMRLPTLLPYLKKFEAKGCVLTKDVISAFANHCKDLQFLVLDNFISRAPHVGIDSFCYLLEQCSTLIHLSLLGHHVPFDLCQKYYRTKISCS